MLALALAQPASAQIFGGKRQDEAIAQLQQQVAALQQQVDGRTGEAGTGLVAEHAATRADLAATQQRVADLESTLKLLNSTVETLTGELAQARRELAASGQENGALRQRVAQLESAAAAAAQAQTQARAASEVATPATTPAPAAPDLAALRDNPAALAAEGRRLLEAGNAAGAETAFTEYLARYGSRSEAPQVRYWLGESLYVQKEHADAAQAYIAALRGWPKAEWAPDALVKLSDTLLTLRQPAEACKSLAELDRRYATAPAAVKARAQQAKTAAKCK